MELISVSLRWTIVSALVALLAGCASIERCEQMGGLVFDITSLSQAPNGNLIAAGSHYELQNCAFEEFVRQSGRRPAKGLLMATSKDNGKSWQALPIPLLAPEEFPRGYDIQGLLANRQGQLFAGIHSLRWIGFSESRDHHAYLLKSDDGGQHWQQVHDFGQDHLLTLVQTPQSVLLAALCNQGILRSEDWGKTWTPLGLALPNKEYCSTLELVVAGNGDLYAYALGNSGLGYYQSLDGGLTWRPLPIHSKGWVGKIAANAKGEVVAAQFGPWIQDMYWSGDRGAHWQKKQPPYESWTEQLAITHDGKILMRSMDNILIPNAGSYISQDQGDHWMRLNDAWTGKNSIPGYHSLLASPSGRLWVNKEIDFNSLPSSWGWGGTIYYSDDAGNSWHSINPIVEKIPQ